MVIFAGDNTSGSCANVTPTIYVDQVGYSRFDFAHNAYDFGIVPPDSVYHYGKVGDTNPVNAGRAPSNDFFYCTTGSGKSDPTESGCDAFYNANIYNTAPDNYLYDNTTSIPNYYEIPRRNLWYTFVINQPGYVTVKVDNKTLGKQDPGPDQYPFTVYKSNVDGTLPFTTVVSSGQVDSTIASGLKVIGTNITYYCYGPNTIQFYRDPCTLGTDRYYVVVDNRNPYGYGPINAMNPNSQVEVSVLVDSVHFPFPKYDHYSEAYDFGTISPPAGVVKGGTDNFSCATADATDPVKYYGYCAQKTLWYKFKSGVTGHVRFRININGTQYTDQSNVQLFTQTKAGDSTSAGLIFQNTNGISDANGYWATNCVEPNTTYYLLVTGCSRVNEYIYPQIEMAEDSGDFCYTPIIANLGGPGTNTSTAVIDCHTIGTDYGEFNPTLTCPAGAQTNSYKSSWYKINIGGTDTLDVTAYLDEKTTAPPSQIQYRLMTGNCGAMQEQSCVQDAQTQNTYKCLAPGGYFIQVFTPVIYNNAGVTGTIDLKLSAIKHADTCAPLKQCLANANFGYTYNCKTDTAVRFINFSTYGSSITYKWDFGYKNQTSTAVSPAFAYPASATDSMYNVRLIATNSSCGGADTAYGTVKVPAHPYVNLGPDIRQCSSTGSVSFNATQPFSGALYTWQDGSTNLTYTATVANQGTIAVTINFASCAITDTVSVYINSIAKKTTQKLAFCPGDSVKLDASYGKGETYVWKNGTANSFIYAKAAGTYWADVSLNGCTFRDSFVVTAVSSVHPLGNDTTICVSAISPYKVDATTGGAVSYKWKDGTTNPLYNITTAGIYWVDINFGTTCNVRDSVIITAATTTAPVITGKQSACYSDSTLLDAGAGYLKYLWSTGDTVEKVYAKATGNYNVKITDKHGCIATSKNVSVTISPKVIPAIVSKTICQGNTYTLPSGKTVSVANTYNDTVKSVLLGCDSVITKLTLSVLKPVKTDTAVIICYGSTYKLPSGKVISTDNIYNDTVRSTGGCDSILTNLTLKVIKATRSIIDTTICSGATFTMPTGKVVSTANTYIDTIKSKTGCDSIITTVNLKVFTATRPIIDTTICAGASFKMPAGKVITTANTYTDTLKNKNGCDSVITTVNLKVFAPTHPIIDTVICDGLTYTMPAGKIISKTGTYIDTLKNTNGCDSVISTVHLKVFTPTRPVIDKAICDGQNYTMPTGTIVTATNTYIDTLKNINGCDSVITTVHLKVNPVEKIFNNVSICIGQSYTLPSGVQVNTAGTYTSNLKNQYGCDSVIVTTVTQNMALAVKLTGITPICKGQSTSLLAQASGGSSVTYKYTWNISNTTNSSLTVTPQTTTKVIVSVSDGCSSSPVKDSIVIQVVPLPVPQFSVTTDGNCQPVTATFTNQTTPQSNSNTYVWNFGDNNITGTATNPAYTYQYPGSYTVSLAATANGCSDTITKANAVNVYVTPVAAFTTDPSPNTIDNSRIMFINKSSNADSWLWSFGDNAGISTERSPTYVYANAGQYTATLIVKNSHDCIDSTSQLIIITGSDGIYIPNAFTPNGDGDNDVFRIKGLGVTVTEMSIYSRWGRRVFYTTADPAAWDGKDQSNGSDCDQAAYVYIIKARLKDGSVHLYRGNIVLIR